MKIKLKNIFNPKSLKQIARDKIKLDDKQLNKDLARNMDNPYYFTDRNLKLGFEINLDSHHINHANTKITIVPKNAEFRIEVRYINKIMKELSVIFARLINQYKLKYQPSSARFDKQKEENQVSDERE